MKKVNIQEHEELFKIACACYNLEVIRRVTSEESEEIQKRLMNWFRWGFMYGYAKAKGLTVSHDGNEVVVYKDEEENKV